MGQDVEQKYEKDRLVSLVETLKMNFLLSFQHLTCVPELLVSIADSLWKLTKVAQSRSRVERTSAKVPKSWTTVVEARACGLASVGHVAKHTYFEVHTYHVLLPGTTYIRSTMVHTCIQYIHTYIHTQREPEEHSDTTADAQGHRPSRQVSAGQPQRDKE